MWSIDFLRRFDASAGFILCNLVRLIRRRKRDFDPPALKSSPRFLCIKCWGIGSVILISPTLRAIKKRWPQSYISFLTLKETAAVCRLIPEIDEVITVKLRRGFFLREVLRLIKQVRAAHFDAVIDFEFSSNFTALVAYWSTSPSVGFTSLKPERDALYDVGVVFDHSLHARDSFARMAQFLDCSPVGEPRLIMPVKAGFEAGRVFLKEPYIVVNPNAGELCYQRRWPLKRYIDLLRELCATTGVSFALIGNSADERYMRPLLEVFQTEPRVVSLVGKLSLIELGALLRKATLYIGNDSGPMHLAATIGTPCVAFFGPETPRLYGPLPPDRHEVFYSHYHCSPCMNVYRYKAANCRSNRCLQVIEVAPVAEAVRCRLRNTGE